MGCQREFCIDAELILALSSVVGRERETRKKTCFKIPKGDKFESNRHVLFLYDKREEANWNCNTNTKELITDEKVIATTLLALKVI